MNLTKPTHLKIILRKLGGRKFKLGDVGITVTKANPPTTAPPSQIIGQGDNNKRLKTPSTLRGRGVNNGLSYAETLRTTTKKEKGADKIPDFEVPRLEIMERKLQVLQNEWSDETFYASDEHAAMYSLYQPT